MEPEPLLDATLPQQARASRESNTLDRCAIVVARSWRPRTSRSPPKRGWRRWKGHPKSRTGEIKLADKGVFAPLGSDIVSAAFQSEDGRRKRAEFSTESGGAPAMTPSGTIRADALGDANGLSREAVEALPAAIYTTDAEGRLTSYNEAAAELWGCRPELGESKFCGSWKLYWPDGTLLPHDECPMALALRERRPIRGMEAVAERPDGTRFLSSPIRRRCSMHPED